MEPSRKRRPRRPALLSEERQERVRRLRQQIASDEYAIGEKFEAIFDDLLKDVVRGTG